MLGQAKYWSELGLYMPLADSAYQPKVAAHQTAYRLYKILNRREDAIYSLCDLAEVHMIYNRIDLAQEEIRQVLSFCEQYRIQPSYQIYRKESISRMKK